MDSTVSGPTERSAVLIGLLSLAVFCTVTAVMMPGPLLVDLAADLDTSVAIAGQLVTTAAAVWAFTAVLIGPFSDAYGRKPVLIVGLCLLATGAIGIGLSESFEVAIVFGLFLGIGGGMVPPTCIALIGDVVPKTKQGGSIAILTSVPGVSSIFGVPAAAVLGDYAEWRVPFLAIGLALICTAVLLLWFVPHHKSDNTRIELFGRLRRVASISVTWFIVATNALARSAWGVIMTFFPAFLIVNYGLRTADVALPVAIVAVWATAAPLLAGRIARERKRLKIIATMLIAATIPALGLFLLPVQTWISVILAGVFMLLIVPVTTILSIVLVETGGAYRGTLAGIISSTNWGGTAAGAAIGGLLVSEVGYGSLSFWIAGVVLASGLLMALFINDNAVSRVRKHYERAPD